MNCETHTCDYAKCHEYFVILINGPVLDVDECASGWFVCKLAVSECINTDGDYECRCRTGYSLGIDGRICIGQFALLNYYQQMNK